MIIYTLAMAFLFSKLLLFSLQFFSFFFFSAASPRLQSLDATSMHIFYKLFHDRQKNMQWFERFWSLTFYNYLYQVFKSISLCYIQHARKIKWRNKVGGGGGLQRRKMSVVYHIRQAHIVFRCRKLRQITLVRYSHLLCIFKTTTTRKHS